MGKFSGKLKRPKAGNETTRRVMAEAERLGYEVYATRGTCHLKFVHPEVPSPVFGPRTPSDNRSMENVIAKLRRNLRLHGLPT